MILCFSWYFTEKGENSYLLDLMKCNLYHFRTNKRTSKSSVEWKYSTQNAGNWLVFIVHLRQKFICTVWFLFIKHSLKDSILHQSKILFKQFDCGLCLGWEIVLRSVSVVDFCHWRHISGVSLWFLHLHI